MPLLLSAGGRASPRRPAGTASRKPRAASWPRSTTHRLKERSLRVARVPRFGPPLVSPGKVARAGPHSRRCTRASRKASRPRPLVRAKALLDELASPARGFETPTGNAALRQAPWAFAPPGAPQPPAPGPGACRLRRVDLRGSQLSTAVHSRTGAALKRRARSGGAGLAPGGSTRARQWTAPREHANPWGLVRPGRIGSRGGGDSAEAGVAGEGDHRVGARRGDEAEVRRSTRRGGRLDDSGSGSRRRDGSPCAAGRDRDGAVATAGERPRPCAACGAVLVSKGHHRATFRSLFGDVRSGSGADGLPCQGPGEPRASPPWTSVVVVSAPELDYVRTVRGAGAFGKVAALLSEPLPIGGAANAGTVRNGRGGSARRSRSRMRPRPPTGPRRGRWDPSWSGSTAATCAAGALGRGATSRWSRARCRCRGVQHRFAFARNGPAAFGRRAPAGTRRSGRGRGHARDRAVRRRCRSVAAAAGGAAGRHARAGLMARRSALRACAAGGPWPRRAPRPPRRARPGAREVAPVARAPGGVPGQARRPAALTGRRPHASGRINASEHVTGLLATSTAMRSAGPTPPAAGAASDPTAFGKRGETSSCHAMTKRQQMRWTGNRAALLDVPRRCDGTPRTLPETYPGSARTRRPRCPRRHERPRLDALAAQGARATWLHEQLVQTPQVWTVSA